MCSAMRRDQERVGEPAPVPIPALEIVCVTHYGTLLISVTPWGLSHSPLQVYEHVCSTSTGVPCGVLEITIILDSKLSLSCFKQTNRIFTL